MSTTATIFSVIGAIAALLVIAGGVWATLTASGREAMMKRLTEDNTYLRAQLEFVEPRFRDAEAKNQLLMKLHNPTAKLESMSAAELANHAETVRLLGEQRTLLVSIEARLGSVH